LDARLDIMEQIAPAPVRTRAYLVHRDIKPPTIFLENSGRVACWTSHGRVAESELTKVGSSPAR